MAQQKKTGAAQTKRSGAPARQATAAKKAAARMSAAAAEQTPAPAAVRPSEEPATPPATSVTPAAAPAAPAAPPVSAVSPASAENAGHALGMLETRGLVAALEASDAMVKAAKVRLIGSEKVGSGLVSVMVCGEVSAVRAAVEAGGAAAAELGEIYALHVIPNPHPDVEGILPTIK